MLRNEDAPILDGFEIDYSQRQRYERFFLGKTAVIVESGYVKSSRPTVEAKRGRVQLFSIRPLKIKQERMKLAKVANVTTVKKPIKKRTLANFF